MSLAKDKEDLVLLYEESLAFHKSRLQQVKAERNIQMETEICRLLRQAILNVR